MPLALFLELTLLQSLWTLVAYGNPVIALAYRFSISRASVRRWGYWRRGRPGAPSSHSGW